MYYGTNRYFFIDAQQHKYLTLPSLGHNYYNGNRLNFMCTSFYISMTTLMERRCAQPGECSFLPKKLMPTNSFFDRLVLGCIRVGKNRAHF